MVHTYILDKHNINFQTQNKQYTMYNQFEQQVFFQLSVIKIFSPCEKSSLKKSIGKVNCLLSVDDEKSIHPRKTKDAKSYSFSYHSQFKSVLRLVFPQVKDQRTDSREARQSKPSSEPLEGRDRSRIQARN